MPQDCLRKKKSKVNVNQLPTLKIRYQENTFEAHLLMQTISQLETNGLV